MTRRGFTIIELLIVIAIIGILSAIVLISLGESRMEARDTVRVATFDQIKSALQIYYTDYGVYPCGDYEPPGVDYTVDSSHSEGFIAGPQPSDSHCPNKSKGLVDIDAYPVRRVEDPLNNATYAYYYKVTEDRGSYILYVPLEADHEKETSDGGFCANYYETGVGVGEIKPRISSSNPMPCD